MLNRAALNSLLFIGADPVVGPTPRQSASCTSSSYGVLVTNALLLGERPCIQIVVYFSEIMKPSTPARIRIRRFITDRYAYRAQPNFLSELVVFGIIALLAAWPLFFLAGAFAETVK
jgi:hypothetical protein